MAQINGTNGRTADAAGDFDISSIIQALELIHNPATANNQRFQAQGHLESVKNQDNIADIGNLLGSDPNQPPLVRHFGLSLLERVIRHRWHQLSEEHSAQFRDLILGLANTLDQTPQPFIRNKIAELWIELAKRCWALDWYGLDECLVQLWSRDAVCKEFALSVLENLSSDVFEREDSSAVLRGKDLNSAVVEIFSSSASYAGGIKVGDVTHHVRFGNEGWLARITDYVRQWLQQNQGSKSTVHAALATLRSSFTWVTTLPIVNAMCLPVICMCLTRQDPELVLAALDVLNALYGRNRMDEGEVQLLVHPLCLPENTAMLQEVYSWSVVGVEDIDTPRYTISKKVAELANHLTDWIVHFDIPENIDFNAFLRLLLAIAEHESLIVSIPAVDCWEKIVQSSKWRRTSAVQSCIQPVLNFATQRLILYDQIPEDLQEPAVLFVNDEIELHPDRQAFYMTYRRFCISIIDSISYKFLHPALDYLLSRVDQALDQIIAAQSSFDPSHYDRTSVDLLKVDAQFTVVDASFRGIGRWIVYHEDEQNQQTREQLKQRVKSWSTNMLSQRNFRDPLMKQRQIKHVVETSNKVLHSDTEYAFKVLEHILSSFMAPQPELQQYSETVKELHSFASTELRRLALEHASYFVTFYNDLEAKFSELIANSNVDEKVQIDLRSTLFLVVQRAHGIEPGLRQERLQSFLEPLARAWTEHQSLLSSFESFTQSQAFDQVGPYLAASRAGEQPDWSSVGFGEDGSRVQHAMSAGAAQLPLRETRVLLSVSTERLEQDSEIHKMICQLWVPLLPIILTSVLNIVSFNHRLHDVTNWPNVPPELRSTVQRVLRDRYWQSGISEGSMVEFQRKVKSTKVTMEGLASSIRGRIRTNLENCYSIVHTLGRLGSYFYAMDQVPEKISEQLLRTSNTLGLHHFGTLLSMLPKLIEECPVSNRQHFLTPIIATLLQAMDLKCTTEWQKLEGRKEGTKQEDDSLSNEMREESVLRQMTYRAVNMVAFWLDPQRDLQLSKTNRIVNSNDNPSKGTQPDGQNQPTMRDFILSNIQILEPLLLFCTHAIAYRDTKTCATMASALQRLVTVHASETHLQGQEASAVREYISSDMLKTLITSLHDGYFADYQNHIATLIAMIWSAYGLPAHIPASSSSSSGPTADPQQQQLLAAHDRPAWTQTPRQVLLSLPGISERDVDQAGAALAAEGLYGKHRRMRAIVLQLLDGVRGVRLSELHKVDMRVQHSKILEKYKQREAAGMQGIEGERGRRGADDDGVDLGGIAGMFGD